GNYGANILIEYPDTNGNIVQGNTIGLSMNGTTFADNTIYGIALWGFFSPVGPQGTIIGGSTPGAGNVIAGHLYNGIEMSDKGTTGNTISGNAIYGNGRIGINLQGGGEDANGVTPNDAGDADIGPNNLQNYPVIASAVLGIGTTIAGTLNSTPNATFRVEFFANANPNPS